MISQTMADGVQADGRSRPLNYLRVRFHAESPSGRRNTVEKPAANEAAANDAAARSERMINASVLNIMCVSIRNKRRNHHQMLS